MTPREIVQNKSLAGPKERKQKTIAPKTNDDGLSPRDVSEIAREYRKLEAQGYPITPEQRAKLIAFADGLLDDDNKSMGIEGAKIIQRADSHNAQLLGHFDKERRLDEGLPTDDVVLRATFARQLPHNSAPDAEGEEEA